MECLFAVQVAQIWCHRNCQTFTNSLHTTCPGLLVLGTWEAARCLWTQIHEHIVHQVLESDLRYMIASAGGNGIPRQENLSIEYGHEFSTVWQPQTAWSQWSECGRGTWMGGGNGWGICHRACPLGLAVSIAGNSAPLLTMLWVVPREFSEWRGAACFTIKRGTRKCGSVFLRSLSVHALSVPSELSLLRASGAYLSIFLQWHGSEIYMLSTTKVGRGHFGICRCFCSCASWEPRCSTARLGQGTKILLASDWPLFFTIVSSLLQVF